MNGARCVMEQTLEGGIIVYKFTIYYSVRGAENIVQENQIQ